MPERVNILDVAFDRLDLRSALARVLDRLGRGERTFVITANPEFVMLARRDPAVARVAREADIVVADGAGIVAASRLLRDPLARVPGRLLVDALVPELAARDASVFLLGAAPGVAERAARAFRAREPRLRIAGCFAGSAADDEETRRRVAAASPDALFVAFGMPRQELWIARNRSSLPSVKLAIGVGGVFDQLAGVQKVAPAVVHRAGLEWLWRLAREPRRWRRQRVLPLFALLVLRRRLVGR